MLYEVITGIQPGFDQITPAESVRDTEESPDDRRPGKDDQGYQHRGGGFVGVGIVAEPRLSLELV